MHGFVFLKPAVDCERDAGRDQKYRSDNPKNERADPKGKETLDLGILRVRLPVKDFDLLAFGKAGGIAAHRMGKGEGPAIGAVELHDRQVGSRASGSGWPELNDGACRLDGFIQKMTRALVGKYGDGKYADAQKREDIKRLHGDSCQIDCE